jgi:formylmethanofuran dehydrogenase subunit E
MGERRVSCLEEVIRSITDPEMLTQIERVVPFHGYLSTGVFVGIQIYNIARRALGFSQGERLFVTCETSSCMPDAFQVLGGCTIGNKGLRIENLGKMAATISRRAQRDAQTVNGIRIVLDPAKTATYPRLHSWYMNLDKVPHEEAISDLIRAQEGVYTWEMVDLEVPEKSEKRIAVCHSCSESFVLQGDERSCKSCAERSKSDIEIGSAGIR